MCHDLANRFTTQYIAYSLAYNKNNNKTLDVDRESAIWPGPSESSLLPQRKQGHRQESAIRPGSNLLVFQHDSTRIIQVTFLLQGQVQGWKIRLQSRGRSTACRGGWNEDFRQGRIIKWPNWCHENVLMRSVLDVSGRYQALAMVCCPIQVVFA